MLLGTHNGVENVNLISDVCLYVPKLRGLCRCAQPWGTRSTPIPQLIRLGSLAWLAAHRTDTDVSVC